MENKFTNDDFDDFLKQSADGLRMRPSDKVWEGISSQLNKRRRRVAFTTSAFLVLSSVLGYFLINSSKDLSRPLATLPSEVKESSNQTSVDQSLSSSSNTEAKIIDITTKRSVPNPQASLSTIKQKASVISASMNTSSLTEESSLAENKSFTPTIVDSYVEPLSEAIESNKPAATEDNNAERLLSIESVTNLFKPGKKKAKVGFQVFFTPTVSYRKLSENRSYLRALPQQSTLLAASAAIPDVNDAVTHKPDIGLEVGMAAKYPITKSLKLRGGLQFNVNRYDIKAFRYTPEVATIALSTNNGVNYVGAVTDYRNFSGYKSDWLQNLYLQVSAPVGAEVQLYRTKKAQFGIAGTIQPTYVLGEKAYLLSNDYKNYSEVPWLTRHWNVNTSLETFVSYSTGKMNWQVGPQVRYQLLSSFITDYPLKENLFDFGFKVGVSINKDSKEKKQP